MPQSANDQVELTAIRQALRARQVSMPQSANDQVELWGIGLYLQDSPVSMPQSANDQVELVDQGFEDAIEVEFQCLSRQTIKWNPVRTRWASSLSSVSMPQSANDQVERARMASLAVSREVSMPQSANDQVEHELAGPGRGDVFKFQCLSRQTIKWNKTATTTRQIGQGVSMPQSANDQVELDEQRIPIATGRFQCLSRQTIKWNVDTTRPPFHSS